MGANFSHHPKYLHISIAHQRAHGLDIVTGSRYRPVVVYTVGISSVNSFIGAGPGRARRFLVSSFRRKQHTKASIADYVLRTHSVLLLRHQSFGHFRYTYKAARKAKTEKAAPDDLSSWRSARLWRSVGTQRGNDSSKSQWQVLETVEPTRDAGKRFMISRPWSKLRSISEFSSRGRGSKRINWRPSHLDQATTNPPPLGGPEVDPVTSEHADSAVLHVRKRMRMHTLGVCLVWNQLPPSLLQSWHQRSDDYFMVVSKRLFKMDAKQRAGLEDWLREKAGIKLWEGQHMEISELVDHTLDFLNQQNKVSLEYFTFAFQRLFKMDQKQRATLETWLQLEIIARATHRSSVLADHTLKFLNQNKNTFSEWLGGEYEEMRKQSLAKEFDPVTLEESIEFYYPSIHEDQRHGLLKI
ncbi:hypothetical protein KEM48_011591 [Puccinia striiformis f. sp. tritici PST-130]|nr:hypothetical protein KEM48_011591 [Puccinia striiformis f. sp. tritici PST-130]